MSGRTESRHRCEETATTSTCIAGTAQHFTELCTCDVKFLLGQAAPAGCCEVLPALEDCTLQRSSPATCEAAHGHPQLSCTLPHPQRAAAGAALCMLHCEGPLQPERVACCGCQAPVQQHAATQRSGSQSIPAGRNTPQSPGSRGSGAKHLSFVCGQHVSHPHCQASAGQPLHAACSLRETLTTKAACSRGSDSRSMSPSMIRCAALCKAAYTGVPTSDVAPMPTAGHLPHPGVAPSVRPPAPGHQSPAVRTCSRHGHLHLRGPTARRCMQLQCHLHGCKHTRWFQPAHQPIWQHIYAAGRRRPLGLSSAYDFVVIR